MNTTTAGDQNNKTQHRQHKVLTSKPNMNHTHRLNDCKMPQFTGKAGTKTRQIQRQSVANARVSGILCIILNLNLNVLWKQIQLIKTNQPI